MVGAYRKPGWGWSVAGGHVAKTQRLFPSHGLSKCLINETECLLNEAFLQSSVIYMFSSPAFLCDEIWSFLKFCPSKVDSHVKYMTAFLKDIMYVGRCQSIFIIVSKNTVWNCYKIHLLQHSWRSPRRSCCYLIYTWTFLSAQEQVAFLLEREM